MSIQNLQPEPLVITLWLLTYGYEDGEVHTLHSTNEQALEYARNTCLGYVQDFADDETEKIEMTAWLQDPGNAYKVPNVWFQFTKESEWFSIESLKWSP